jgi:hypothetical protein
MSIETKQLMKALPSAQRKQVERIVLRFANQHADAGILPHELEPVYRDVIDAVRWQAFFPTNFLPAVKSWEQAQHYVQFVAPQFDY